LIAERVEQEGKATVARQLEYDSAGRLVRVTVPDKNGTPRVSETYSYSADNKKQKVVHLEPKLIEPSCGVFVGVEGSELGFGVPGIASTTCNYDTQGRPIEHLCHDSGGELLARINLQYDDRGNLIEEICVPERLPPEITAECSAEQLATMLQFFIVGHRHRYDARNRRIETSAIRHANDQDSRIFEYNDQGDVVAEISSASHSDYNVVEDGSVTTKPDSTRAQRSETQIRYQYDDHGNWIEKIVATPDGRVWSTEHRTIQYFDAFSIS
jgi:YD repeat-containing protein